MLMTICRQPSLLLLVAFTFLTSAQPALAQDDLEPSTELGVTITPDDIYDSIQETSDFWPPVRTFVEGPKFSCASDANRQQAGAFLKQVHRYLHDQLFEKGEAEAYDLIEYVTWRLRKFAFLRQLRDALGNDELFARVKADWDRLHREANDLPEAEREAARANIPDQVIQQLAAAGVDAKVRKTALETWQQVATCSQYMDATEAGRQMLVYEQQAKQLDYHTARLMRDVVAAAEWALIVKPDGHFITLVDFQTSWNELAGCRNAEHTASRPNEVK